MDAGAAEFGIEQATCRQRNIADDLGSTLTRAPAPASIVRIAGWSSGVTFDDWR